MNKIASTSAFAKKLYGIFTYPIRKEFRFFLLSLLLSAGFPDYVILSFRNLRALHLDLISITMYGIATAYVAAALVAISPKKIRKPVLGTLFAILFILSILDVAVFATIHQVFYIDHIYVLAGTNIQESKEFVLFYFRYTSLLYLLGWIALIVVTWRVSGLNRVKSLFSPRVRKYATALVALAILASTAHVLTAKDEAIRASSVTGKLSEILSRPFSKLDPPPLQINTSDRIEKIPVFLIIGESCSRTHCQVYGYREATTPHLAALPPDRMVVFDSISSPATHTIASFMRFMTTTEYCGAEWNKSHNIPQLLRQAGYHSVWLSNQEHPSFIASIVNRFAEEFDATAWTGIANMAANMHYDGELLPIYDHARNHITDSSLTLFHFMGSHPIFTQRYPAGFSGFTPEHYTYLPANQRKAIAQYDTSVLYTDSVLSEIFRRADAAGALAIYFSDHGLDLFASGPHFIGHAKPGNPESVRAARQIPFMVYIPESVERRRPELTARIRAASHRPGNTSQLFFTLMDILGATSPQWPDATRHSLFHAE